ncbi:MAG TPA: hypothetical protein VGO47_00485, partial [Chlamydiales bacterium]|nr:hypothetical protein [Chlamydiales bacterium]
RPPSPATLSREFQESRGPENVEKSDQLTASINLEELKREAQKLTGKEVTGVFKIGEGLHTFLLTCTSFDLFYFYFFKAVIIK